MKYLLILLFGIFFSSSANSQPKTNTVLQPQQVIELVFEALSDGNMTKMEQAVTPDIKILEHGVVWTLDTVRLYLSKKRPGDFKRINSFEFFQTEIKDNMAFVSYHNRADIHANNKDRTVKWLESAVLVKENNSWKVKMLHSTRLE
jgi:hypothetical protein